MEGRGIFDRCRICQIPIWQKREVAYPIQKSAHRSAGLAERLTHFSPGGYLCVSKIALEHKFANKIELCSKLRLTSYVLGGIESPDETFALGVTKEKSLVAAKLCALVV